MRRDLRESRNLAIGLVAVLVLTLTSACSGSQPAAQPTQAPAAKAAAAAPAPAEKGAKPKDYPTRTVQIVIPWATGGGTDIYVRTLQKPLEKALGVQVNIINMPGAEGVAAFNKVNSDPADGYTIFAIGPEEIMNHVMKRYNFNDLVPVLRAQQDQSVLWVAENSPYKGIKEILEDAKANPGKQKWDGARGYDDVAMGLFIKKSGVKVDYVPYDKANEADAAVAGGHFVLGHEEIGSMLPLWESKKVRPIVVFSDKRLPKYQDIPTTKDLGVDVTLGRWRGMAVKKGTPQPIIDYLDKLFHDAMDTPEYKQLAEKTVTDQRPGYLNASDFAKSLQEEMTIYEQILKELGLAK